MRKLFLLVTISVISTLAFGGYSASSVKAQGQDFNFSGNDRNSYQCFYQKEGQLRAVLPSNVRDEQGFWLCNCLITSVDIPLAELIFPSSDGEFEINGVPPSRDASGEYTCSNGERATRATLKPPKIQQLEVWFVQIVFVIWALVASLSFFFLVALGYQYMISRGDPTKIAEIRQKIVNYFIGLVIVFLAVPILSTIFRLLGINENISCYRDIDMPGFQFFFEDVCTEQGLVRAEPTP